MKIKRLFGGALNGPLANILLPLLGVLAMGNLFVSQQTGQIVFEGIPEMKLQANGKSENPHALQELSRLKIFENRCVIIKKGDRYYWKSRERKKSSKNIRAVYTPTLRRANGALEYVRIVHPRFANFATLASDYTYVEHLVHTLTTITYWGHKEIL